MKTHYLFKTKTQQNYFNYYLLIKENVLRKHFKSSYLSELHHGLVMSLY